jgi:hypothetical protein
MRVPLRLADAEVVLQRRPRVGARPVPVQTGSGGDQILPWNAHESEMR